MMVQVTSLWLSFLLCGHVFIALTEGRVEGIDKDCSFYSLIEPTEGAFPRPTYRLMNFDPMYTPSHQVTKWTIQSQDHIKADHGWSEHDFDSAGGYDLYCLKVGLNEGTTIRRKALLTIGQPSTQNHARVVCIEFQQKGGVAFQIKNSEPKLMSVKDVDFETMCHDGNLVSDHGLVFMYFPRDYNEWVKAKGTLSYLSCSLNGGFAIKHWIQYSPGETSECTSPEEANLRVEDECEKGGGMLFSHSKVKDCKSPLYGRIYRDDPLTCFTSWYEGDHVYTIAYDDNPNIAMCYRMPREGRRGQAFQIQVFFDGICKETTSPKYAGARHYLKISLYSKNISGVCDDVSPWCSKLKLDTVEQRNSCPGSSSLCDGSPFWESLTTPEELRGDWFRETEYLGEGHVTISEQVLDFQHLGRWTFAGVNKCHKDELDAGKAEYFILSLPENGCRPRVALLRIRQFSDSVMGFQLSHSSVIEPAIDRRTGKWPLSPDTFCHYERLYFGVIKENIRDMFHIGEYGWYNLVREGHFSVKCDLSKFQKFTMKFGKDRSCQVKIKQPDKNAFDMVADSCSEDVKNLKIGQAIHHECLAYFKGTYGWQTFMITKSLEQNPFERKYVCWILSNEEPLGYVMRVGDCHGETVPDIDNGYKHPLASISRLGATSATNTAAIIIPQYSMLIFMLLMYTIGAYF